MKAQASTASSASWGLGDIDTALEGLKGFSQLTTFAVVMDAGPSSSALRPDVLKEAEEEAMAQASSAMASKRGAQKKAVMAAKSRQEASKQTEINHPSLGRLWISKASSQGYVQYESAGKKKMLIGCTKSMASKSTTAVDHNEVVQTLPEVAAQHGLDKPNLVLYRDTCR